MKKEIIKIITENTEYWLGYGEMDSCFIIEEKEPFFWRISPQWAESVALKIIEFLGKEGIIK